MNLQNRKKVTDIENKLWLPKWRGIDWEIGIDTYALLYTK